MRQTMPNTKSTYHCLSLPTLLVDYEDVAVFPRGVSMQTSSAGLPRGGTSLPRSKALVAEVFFVGVLMPALFALPL